MLRQDSCDNLGLFNFHSITSLAFWNQIGETRTIKMIFIKLHNVALKEQFTHIWKFSHYPLDDGKSGVV